MPYLNDSEQKRFEDAFDCGFEEGLQESRMRLAAELLVAGWDRAQILDVTELSEEELSILEALALP